MDLARSACYLEYAPCRVRCPEHGVRTEAGSVEKVGVVPDPKRVGPASQNLEYG